MKSKEKKDGRLKLPEEEANARKDIIDIMLRVMQFQQNSKFPTSFTKKLAELKECYSYVEIKYTMLKVEDNLFWAIKNKEFKSDYSKINYLMAVIQNNINKYRKELIEINKNQVISENKEVQELSVINTVKKNPKQKKMDMSEFID